MPDLADTESGSPVADAPPHRRPRGRPRKTAQEQGDGNRHRKLMNAAAKLFRTGGFAATGTRDIAAAADMHSGSPFCHFESKGALPFAVMHEDMATAVQSQQPPGADANLCNQTLALFIHGA